MAIFGVQKSASAAGVLRKERSKRSSVTARVLGVLTSAALVMSGAIVGGTAAHAEESSVTILDPSQLPEGWNSYKPDHSTSKDGAWFFTRFGFPADYTGVVGFGMTPTVKPGELVTYGAAITNHGDVDFPAVSYTDSLALTLNQSSFVEGSFATSDPTWSMGEIGADGTVKFSGSIAKGKEVYLQYQVRVFDLADMPAGADYVLDSDSDRNTGSPSCGGMCYTTNPIEKTLTLSPNDITKVYSEQVSYSAEIIDGWNGKRTVTDETTFTSEAGPMVDNLLTVKQVGTGMKTTGAYDQFTATATVKGTESPVPAVTIDPSNGSTISGTGVTGNTVTVTLPSGAEQTVPVVDGKWSLVPNETLEDGDIVTVAQKDKDGFFSPDETVMIDKGTPAAPAVNLSNGKTITGGPVAAGSTLKFTDENQNPIPGTVAIDPETGLFTFTPEPPHYK